MKIVWELLILVALVFIALVVIMGIPFLRKSAGYGSVEPTGPAASISKVFTKSDAAAS